MRFPIGQGDNLLAGAFIVGGMLLWLVTYYFIIRRGFRDSSYGIPWIAVCLNFASEFYLGFVCCPECQGASSCSAGGGAADLCAEAVGLQLAIVRTWLLLDVVVLYQVLRYGAQELKHRALRGHFPLLVALGLVLAYQGRITFIPSVADRNGQLDAWMINLVMSILFVLMAIYRSLDAPKGDGVAAPRPRGLSYEAAWTRLLANVLIAVGLLISGYLPTTGRESLFHYLFIGVFVFDLTYLYLLHNRRGVGTETAGTAG